MAYREVPIDTQVCHRCGASVEAGIDLCPRCGAPTSVAEYAELALKLEPMQKSARRWLAIAAGLSVVGLVSLMSRNVEGAVLLLQGLLTGVFAGAWALSRRFPMGAPLAAACVYGMLELAALVVVGMGAVISGAVVKLLLFFALVRGVQSGYRIRDLQRRAGRHDRLLVGATIAGFAAAGVLLGLVLRA